MNSDQYNRVVSALHEFWSGQPDIQTITETTLDRLGEMLRQDMLAHRVVLAEDGVWLPRRLGAACRITVRDGGIDVSGAVDKVCTELRTFSERGLDKALPEWRAWVTESNDSGSRPLENEE